MERAVGRSEDDLFQDDREDIHDTDANDEDDDDDDDNYHDDDDALQTF